MRRPLLSAEKVAYLRREQINKVYKLIRLVGPTQLGTS
jgi:hypothetical protein